MIKNRSKKRKRKGQKFVICVILRVGKMPIRKRASGYVSAKIT